MSGLQASEVGKLAPNKAVREGSRGVMLLGAGTAVMVLGFLAI